MSTNTPTASFSLETALLAFRKQLPGSTSADLQTFILGYKSRDEEVSELVNTLKAIADWPGNLPDERYTSRTGANDASLRGGMVVAMRAMAKNMLSKYLK